MPDPNETQPSNRPVAPATYGATVASRASAEADEETRVKDTFVDTVSADGTPVVAGYDTESEIARGSMGVVYAAVDRAFGREVAVKVMLPGMSAAAFDREARITARLPHPGIPPVHALGALPDGRPFLAMKLIRGDTLKDLLDGRTDPTADRARMLVAFKQICQAVGYPDARAPDSVQDRVQRQPQAAVGGGQGQPFFEFLSPAERKWAASNNKKVTRATKRPAIPGATDGSSRTAVVP